MEPDWENVRYLLILADMRCIFGSRALVDRAEKRVSCLCSGASEYLEVFVIQYTPSQNNIGRIRAFDYREIWRGCRRV